MNNLAVPPTFLSNHRWHLGVISVALTAVMLLFCLESAASAAAPVGKSGQIHACYRAKGKSKGAMRLVGAKQRCKRGERKVSWSVAGGPTGATGASGPTGSQGPSGSTSSSSSALESEVAALKVEVGSLKSILSGVTSTELTGALSKLNGITGVQLGETVKALPMVSSLCSQDALLTTQLNTVQGVVGGISLGGVLPIGLLLNTPSLPAELTSYTCPA
jgi:hypothetical protein